MELMPIDGEIITEFGGYKHKGRITAATFNAEKGFGEYTVKINLRKSIQEEKKQMSTTQYNWYVGMPVIMTADSRKGKVAIAIGIEYGGTYEGVITGIYSQQYEIFIHQTNDRLCFNLDGSCSTHPGMSIRPADCTPGQMPIEKPTPSQWIEGKAPPVGERTGGVFIGKHDWEKPVYYSIDEVINIQQYTHWQYIQLPPPPPVAEVEAFGFLECVSKAKYNDIEYIENARRFYSQTAIKEVLNKYLDVKGISYPWERNEKITIDQFISYYKRYWGNDRPLLFTPAALDMLGVK